MITYLSTLAALQSVCRNWIQIVIAKVLKLPLKQIILKSGVRFATVGGRIGKADLSMFAETWYHEFYTPPLFEINPSDTVIDVGGNNGYFTVFAGSKARSGNVFVFEPTPSLAQAIRTNVALNNLKNVQVEEAAMAESDGHADFFVSKVHNGMHSLIHRHDTDDKISVKKISLATFCKERGIKVVDHLKMDCEGAEYEILLKAPKELLRSIKRISLEYHDDLTGYTHRDLVNHLNANNFTAVEKNGYVYALNKEHLERAK